MLAAVHYVWVSALLTDTRPCSQSSSRELRTLNIIPPQVTFDLDQIFEKVVHLEAEPDYNSLKSLMENDWGRKHKLKTFGYLIFSSI